ncbi:hypothetical protein [Streptomyces mirabilis]|uniref:hypothetical protein n=1 Tax=Streptomyces mirabilis TaxID=68239 RepID=UPI003722228D
MDCVVDVQRAVTCQRHSVRLTLNSLRQDRILNEAAESADPLRLMRLFGITE